MPSEDQKSQLMRSFMYRRPNRRIKRSLLFFALLSLTVGLLFLIPSISPRITVTLAETGPKIISGHVYDSLGQPVQGALVTVTIATYSHSFTSGSTGYYMVTFLPSEWTRGDTIEVTATYESLIQTNTTTADLSGMQTVDINFLEEIPEVGQIIGLAIAVPAFVLFVRKLRPGSR